MTTTALKALTVIAASAAILLTAQTGTALANPSDQPGAVDDPGAYCAPGEEYQGEFGCVAVQLPEERDGRATDPLPSPEDPCFRQDAECYDIPVLSQPGPAAEPQPDAPASAAEAPLALGSPQTGTQPLGHAAAPVPAAPAGPAAVDLTDLWHQILDWIRWLFGSIM